MSSNMYILPGLSNPKDIMGYPKIHVSHDVPDIAGYPEISQDVLLSQLGLSNLKDIAGYPRMSLKDIVGYPEIYQDVL